MRDVPGEGLGFGGKHRPLQLRWVKGLGFSVPVAAPMPKVASMRTNIVTAQSASKPADKWYTGPKLSGTVSPKWIMMRMACSSGWKNSCPLALNSVSPHLQERTLLPAEVTAERLAQVALCRDRLKQL